MAQHECHGQIMQKKINWRQVQKRRAYLLLFFHTQAVGGRWAYRCNSSVFRGSLPALPGAYTELNLTASHCPSSTRSDGLIYPHDKRLLNHRNTTAPTERYAQLDQDRIYETLQKIELHIL
jgi:hypothetical protein